MSEKTQFSLQMLLGAMGIVAVLFGLLDWLPAFLVVLLATAVVIAVAWSASLARRHFLFALCVATLHTILIALLCFVPDGPSWNDTALGRGLGLTAYVVDAPVFLGLEYVGLELKGIEESLRIFQMNAAWAGGAFWFLVAILFWNVPRRILGPAEQNVEFDEGRTIRSVCG